MSTTALIILDGFGNGGNDVASNAILAAGTPNIDRYKAAYATTAIGASGLDVGLPDGQMGNSEVGHTNIGAGRIVYQMLVKISKSITDGDFFEIDALKNAIENCKNKVEYEGIKENAHFFKRPIKHTFEEFKAIVDSWGLKFTPRPYQYTCAYKILQWKSSISQLATRAGKTMLAYIVFRYAMEHMGMKRILMIVPSIDLVKQGYNDFNDYEK